MAPRAYWKGYLKLSLVSCPIALFPATSEREKISFHQLNKKTGHRVRYRKVDAETGHEVDSADIITGYEVGKSQYIELDPEELEAVAIESKRTIDINEFVPKDALEARGKGLLGITLRYPHEVRNEADYFDGVPDEKIPKDMLELASHIVETKAGHFDPSKFDDRYEDALKDLLKKKQEGKPIERPERREPTNVVNLMDALRRSVEASGARAPGKERQSPVRRKGSSEQTEQPKRKKTRRAS